MKKTGKIESKSAGSGKGLLGKVAEETKNDLNITPQTVTNALVKDAKQAVNYEIRKGLRSFINGFFKK